MINRAALIVRPAKPFIDRAAGLDDSGLVPDVGGEQTVYLIPEFDTEAEAWNLIESMYEDLFEAELFGWHTDRSAWPTRRDFATFKAWFKIELHSVVVDVGVDPIDDEDAP